MDRSAQLASSDLIPASRLAWLAGSLGTAAQPSRLAVGFLVAFLLWAPGLAWDASVGPAIDPPGLLAEPWEDIEQDDAQRTLRRLVVQLAPELNFEGPRIPAAQLAADLADRADKLGLDPEADRMRMGARRAASLASLGSFQALCAAQADACSAIVDGTIALDIRQVAAGFRAAVIDIPVACFTRDTVFACVFGSWSLLILAVGFGALARMEVMQLAGRGLLTAREGLGFAVERWSTLLLAWVGPVAIAAVLGAACLAWGFLFRSSIGGWIGAVLYIAPLFVGAIAGLALIIAAVGAPTAPAAVACDGIDALESSQRGGIYFLARPVLWVMVQVCALAVIAIGLVIVRITAWAMTAFPATMVDLGAGGLAPVHSLSPAPLHWAIPLDGRSFMIWAWVLLLGIAVTGASLSLIAGAFTRVYLLLREACDGQPPAAVWPFETPLDVSETASGTAPRSNA